ncbi:class I adenylate-forming enzyme family protein [Parafrankia sp. EUN1f]|uniref:class I adenylate-forming enzyme family protein n=1 Tax=Parafrankia sp. EUN1f TaxID=102897 RepID=UPI0001C44A8E|nr:class I adenylate-forming enzyme family protein [Parafrankia sp. EUN1f]EFC84139.1 AMP-dependent synthetase and ligase [Parafrankia sp. EUN1f]
MAGWPDLTRIPPSLLPVLTGPGAPFELVREDVRGVEMTVFAQRPRSLPELLAAAAREHPDRPYLVLPERTVTYREAADAARAVAAALRSRHGIAAGDRVALAGANSAEHALTIWGVLLLGAVVVGLNGWWTGPELAAGLALTEPALLVADEPRLARLTQLDADAGSKVVADAVAGAVSFTDLAVPAAAGTASETGETGAPAFEPAAVEEDDACAILFTSGTSGRPKGALISHRGLVNFAMDAALRGAVEAVSGAAPPPAGTPVSVLTGPFFHISGLGPLTAVAPRSGMTLVLPPPGRWDPAVHLELTARHGVTQWSGVPTQILRLLEHPDLDRMARATIRSVGCGGATISPELPRLLEQRMPGTPLTNGYGMTETCGLGTAISGPRLAAHPTSAGVPTPTAEVVVRDESGAEITDGRIGELWIRCPSTFLGYWGESVSPVDDQGWYPTGDYGRFEGGLLQVESRLRDMIVRGGENIYPIEIENRLLEHADVADAAVIGVAHRELGQEVLAVIVPRHGAVIDPADVRAWVGASLAAFKVPAHVTTVSSLPRNTTGKVLKQDLRERFDIPPGADGGTETGSGSGTGVDAGVGSGTAAAR